MGDIVDQLRTTLTARSDERALEFDGVWVSWGDVARFGDALVAALDAAGCPPQARVGIIIRNRVAHAAAVIGLLAHRRSISFAYPFLPPGAMFDHIADMEAGAILADIEDWDGFFPAVKAAGAAGIALSTLQAGPVAVAGLERCESQDASAQSSAAESIDVLSSGTTGAPKRISMPFALLERAVFSAPGQESGEKPEVQINIWPLGGVGGMCLLTASAVHGTPMVLFDRFSVEKMVDAIRRHRPAMLGLNATAIAMMMDADIPVEALSSLRVISGGSAHLDPDLQDRFEERFGVPILWGMGATEFCGTIVRWTPELRAEFGASKRGSVGKTMPGVDLRIVDPDSGTPLPAGAEGLMEVYCPTVRPDWVRTTDLGIMDADGFVYHRGRHDGAIVRGGFKIMPERVVDTLRGHPAVADASVVGIADARLGEVPVAAVELRSSVERPTEQALIDHVRAALPATYVPTRVVIVDTLPRTPSLKASLVDVRKLFS